MRGCTVQAESELVRAAQTGDHAAFTQLASPHYDGIRVHCYRMLGSFHDAEDAVQESLVKAWRKIGQFEGRSLFGTWLHSIATTTCLNLIRRRPRVVVPSDFTDGPRPPAADVPWLEPYPDIHLPAPSGEQPDARIEAKEATRLAFVATMQLLPARQRAVLLLRDVLMFTSGEVAEVLDTTTAAVNSALQRARARLAEHRTWEDTTAEVEATVDEFVRLWEACDIDGLVGLLTDDAHLAMPPIPAWFLGPQEIGRFLATGPADGRLELIRLVPTRANGQPAVAAYLPSTDGGHYGYGVMVFDSAPDGRIAAITGFNDGRLMSAFALPQYLGDPGGGVGQPSGSTPGRHR
jgi:RNA polymerase sigma-70 factor (TIGR02960 family)